MNPIEFVRAGLHNRHIRFIMNGSMYEGVVVDNDLHNDKRNSHTLYTFISTENMALWKEAERNSDRERMERLSSVVDIEQITWGVPLKRDNLITEVALAQYLNELLDKATERFRNSKLDAEIPNSDYRIDIATERKNSEDWDKLFVEVKSLPTYIEDRLKNIIDDLKIYQQHLNTGKIVFAFPGILPQDDIEMLRAAGLEVWDRDYISEVFKEEIEKTPHLFFQAFFTKTTYTNEADDLIKELKSIRAEKKEKNEWPRYQKYIQKVLEYLFGPTLSSPISEHSDYFGVNRRDFILRNYAEAGFWAHIRNRYSADYIVVEAKNHSDPITKGEILQISNYLKVHGPGLFGLVFTRKGGDDGSYYTCREIWAMDNKMVIVLNDDDLEKMITAKQNTDNPEEIVRQKIEEFRLSM